MRTTFTHLARSVSFALQINMPTDRETRIIRILYLKIRRSSLMLNALTSACFLFWMYFHLHYISCNLMICLSFTHLLKCFSVAVNLLCFIRKAVCSAVKTFVHTYFFLFTTIFQEYRVLSLSRRPRSLSPLVTLY